MANLVRIKNLDRERDLNNVIIPVDKITYLDNAKQISISGLTDFIMSGFTGSTTIYSHTGLTTVSVGGIPSGVAITGMTITELFNWIFYSGTPPTTTTTTTPAAPTTTTTTTPAPTTTTTTTPAPTTTTTTTVFSYYHLVNVSLDLIVTDIEVGGISLSASGAIFPSSPSPDPSFITDGTRMVSGTVAIVIYYTYTDVNQNIMINTNVDGTICNMVTVGTPFGGGYKLTINLNITSGETVNIYCWPGACF